MKHALRIFGATVILLTLSSCQETTDSEAYVGYVEAEWRYIVAPGSGWLVSRPALEGVSVTEGDVLFELDRDHEQVAVQEAESRIEQAQAEADNLATGARPAELRALQSQLAEAEARLYDAKAERDRVLPLVERGLEPERLRDQVIANFDQATAAVDTARDNIEIARLAGRDAQRAAAAAQSKTAQAVRAAAEVRLARRTVYAGLSGTVTEVFHYEGEFVTTGSPVLAIQPAGGLKIRFFVSQSKLTQLRLGKKVSIRADGLTSPISATVTYIATQAEFTPPVIYSRNERDKLVFAIEATLPEDSGLLPGLAVDVDWT